ncbi:MAG: PAS domain S-box protein, partial [Rhodocyclaceae bacterium]
MLPAVLPWHSLKTKLTLATLGVFLVAIWSLSFFASNMLRQDVRHLLGEQQMSTVTVFAAHVNNELVLRLNALERLAALSAQAMEQGPAAMQSFLANRSAYHNLFNGGGRAYRPDRAVVAQVPGTGEQRGGEEIDLAAVTAVLETGLAKIGRPVRGKGRTRVAFDMAAPIRNEKGRVIGVLTGSINLGAPSFLDPIHDVPYAKTGTYLIISPQNSLVVASTERGRSKASLSSPDIDRLMRSDEGTHLMVDAEGGEMLASVMAIPVANWILAAVLPSREAFAPIDDLQRRMRFVTLLLSLATVALTWWILRRQLAPLTAAAGALTLAAKGGQPIPPLRPCGRDEIGQLVGTFNQLMAVLGQRDAALQTSETRLRRLFQDIPSVAVQGYGPDTTTRYWNQASERLYGYTAEEAVGRSLLDLIIPAEMREAVRLDIRTMFETGQPIPARELCLMRKDGSRVAVYSSHAYVQVPGQDPEMFCVDIDLTDRKRIEEALREREQSLQAVLDNFPFMVWLKDGDSRYIAVNRFFASVTGWPSPDSVIGRDDLDVAPPDLAEGYRADDRSVLATGQSKHVEELIETEGERRWFETYKSPITVEGRLIGTVGFARDITERKRAELALQESEADLKHAQAVGRIGSWRLDVQRNALRWSEENHRIFGIPEGVPLSYQTFLSCVHPEDRERVNREWSAALQGAPYDIEHRIVVAGEERWVRERA